MDYNKKYMAYKHRYLKLKDGTISYKNLKGGESIEYEYQFLNIDENKIKNILRKYGGKRIYDKVLMNFNTYITPGGDKNIQVRLRDEGNKITFTVKTKSQ